MSRNNIKGTLSEVKQNLHFLDKESENFQNDKDNKEVVLEVKQNGSSLKYASEELKSDKEVVLQAVKQNGRSLEFASEELKNDKEIVLEAVKQKVYSLYYASEELKKDKEFILNAVKQDGRSLEFASEELKNDKEIVLEAVKQKVYSLRYASEELKNDKEFILNAVKQDGRSLSYASEELKSDKGVVLEAVKQSGSSLQFASEELKNNKDIVLESVKKDGSSYKFSSEELKNDKEVVLEIVKQYGLSIQMASDELKNDKEFLLEAVKLWGSSLQYASEELKNDKEVVLEAVKDYVYSLRYASEELKNDKEFILEAIKQKGSSLQFASEEFQNDKEFIRECCLVNREAIQGIGKTLSKKSLLVRKMKRYVPDVERAYEEFVVERNEKGGEEIVLGIENFFVNLCFELFKKKWESTSLEDLKVLIGEGERLKKEMKLLNVNLRYEQTQFPLLTEKIQKWKNEIKLKNPKLGDIVRLTKPKRTKGILTPLQNKNICFQDIKFFRLVGSGAFGRPYLCKIVGICGLFVVKLYKQAIQGFITKEKAEKQLKSDCIKLPPHPNVVPILFHSKSEKIDLSQLPDFEEFWKPRIGTNYKQEGGMLIMKYHHLSLHSLMEKRKLSTLNKFVDDYYNEGSFLPSELIILMKGILSGVFHLHSNHIVHRDLHPGNVFVHPSKGRVLIGDYGCSLDLRENRDPKNPTGFQVHKDHEILYSVSGSERNLAKTGGARSYCAPEIKEFDGSKSDYLDYSKSDLYSCGLLGKEVFDLLDEKRLSKENEDYWKESKSFLELLQLLMLDFENRITFEEVNDRINKFNEDTSDKRYTNFGESEDSEEEEGEKPDDEDSEVNEVEENEDLD